MTKPNVPLSAMLNVLVFTPGRRIFALRRVREAAQALELAALIEAIDRAVAFDQDVALPARLSYTRQRQGSGADPEMVALDNAADRLVTAIDSDLKHIAHSFRPGSPLKQLAADLRRVILPGGARFVTALPFAEQHAALVRMVDRLTGPHADAALQLGLGPKVAELSDIAQEYGEALHTPSEATLMTYPRYRVIDQRGQRLLLGVIARIIGLYPDDEAPAADLQARTALLAPILAQQASIRDHNRSSRDRAPDIDPNTGAVLQDDGL